jgi:glycine/D-amino acid oxidase-like deaminating enzyme/nitrite reductase/ring-hydroxylating ferredoxin subunit
MRTSAKDGGFTSSIWHDTRMPSFDTPPALETDVCIIGAGIAGLSTALELARGGTRVSVIDDGPIGGGETGRTTAHLASAVDDRFHKLEKRFGERGARLVAESHAAAIDKIEQNVREFAIDCEFRRVEAYLFSPPGDDLQELEVELGAARRAGLIVDRVERGPLDLGPALRFANQAEIHPLRYLRGLAEAVIEHGGHIHTHCHVESIDPHGKPLVLKLAGGRSIHCRIAIDATNGAISSPIKLPIRQAAYRSYVLGFDLEPGAIPHMLLWDTEDPYHYVRVATGPSGRDVLVVGGEDHRTGQGNPEHAFGTLAHWARQRFRFAGPIVERWSGQILEPADGLAFIGACPDLEHVYVVTGDSGNGMTHGTIAAMVIPELARGRRSAWAELYDPKRRIRGIGTLIKEAAYSTAPYADWLRGGDVASEESIRRNSGALVRHGLHVVAAYRDGAGELHSCSATCPHLRGVVQWNQAEQTWDCPCHGSRFDAYGRVLNGPALKDLERIEPVPEKGKPVPVREKVREEIPVAVGPFANEPIRRS